MLKYELQRTKNSLFAGTRGSNESALAAIIGVLSRPAYLIDLEITKYLSVGAHILTPESSTAAPGRPNLRSIEIPIFEPISGLFFLRFQKVFFS